MNETISPKLDAVRGRWVVDIPPSWFGRRSRRWFSDKLDASRFCHEAALRRTLGGDQPVSTGEKLADLAAAFLAHKKEDVADVTWRQLRWGISMLSASFPRAKVQDIDPERAGHWGRSLKLSTRGRYNAWSCARTFYNWRPVRQVVRDNPFEDAPPRRDRGKRLPILSPQDIKLLLQMDADDETWWTNWVALGAFAGLRSCEVERLKCSSIDYEFGDIVVRREDSKGGLASRPRNITIQKAFLRHYSNRLADAGESVVEGMTLKRIRKMTKRAAGALGLSCWPRNCLRHSFASYHLAEFADPSKTSFEMGHASPSLLYSTYANSVTRRDAKAYWTL